MTDEHPTYSSTDPEISNVFEGRANSLSLCHWITNVARRWQGCDVWCLSPHFHFIILISGSFRDRKRTTNRCLQVSVFMCCSFLVCNLKYVRAGACRWEHILSYVVSGWSKSLTSDTDMMITYVPVFVPLQKGCQLLMQHLISHNFIQLIYSGRIK